MKTPHDNEETIRLRTNILRQLDAASPSSLRVSTLLIGARDEAFAADEKQIEIECEHLADPDLGLIRREKVVLGGGVKRFTLTAKGRDQLREMGF